MDKLIEKHKFICQTEQIRDEINSTEHANITKEIAVGFAEWSSLNYLKVIDGDIWIDTTIGLGKTFTTSELFDLYLKSLQK